MLADIYVDPRALFPGSGTLWAAVVALLSASFITFLLTLIQSASAVRSKAVCEPPIVPYWTPSLGNLIPFWRNVAAFASNIT